jgi:uncharacterized protein
MLIKRTIYPKLKTYLKKPEIMALIGSRQVGKTTLLKELYSEIKESKNFISFDNELVLNQFENNLETFEMVYVKPYKYLFIDEFQYAKKGGKKLKYLYDKYKIKIIISGSSAPELSINSLSFLTGRIFVFEIYPLSFEEFLNYKNPSLEKLYLNKVSIKDFELIKQDFEEFLLYGGYPQVVLQKNSEEKIFALKNLVGNYLLKEIKDILDYKSSFEFENLLKFLALTDSTILNKSNISSDLGIHILKITEMINVLKNIYILNILTPYTNVKIKELIKSPKTYFLDLGFKNLLINNFNKLDLRTDKGAILENFVLSEYVKKDLDVKFYNYKNRSEIDFVLNQNSNLLGIEIKSKLSFLNIQQSFIHFFEKTNSKKIMVLNLNQEGTQTLGENKIIFTNILNLHNLDSF